jgi:hypothetical protein
VHAVSAALTGAAVAMACYVARINGFAFAPDTAGAVALNSYMRHISHISLGFHPFALRHIAV